MKKIALAVCGSSGIDYIDPNHGLYMFRSTIIINGKEYIDYIDIDAKTVYDKMDDENAKVHTAQIATGHLLKMMEDARDAGYEEMIFITISSGLSSTIQGIYTAASMVEGIKIYPYDSRFIGYSIARQALVAKRMIEEGKSVEEIFTKLDEIRDSQKLFFVVDSVKYLVRSGRLSVTKGLFATLLNIKPILQNNKDGSLELYKKVRAKTKAISIMVEDFLTSLNDLNDVEPFILFTNNYQEALDLKKDITDKYPKYQDINIYHLPPVIGAHSGPRALAVGYVKKG